MTYKKLITLILGAALCSGYSGLYISDSDKSSDKLYGRRKGLSVIHSRAELFDGASDLKCEGMIIILQHNPEAADSKKLEPGLPFGRFRCNDDRIIEMRWSKTREIVANDQFGRIYPLKDVSSRKYSKFIKSLKVNEKSKKSKKPKKS